MGAIWSGAATTPQSADADASPPVKRPKSPVKRHPPNAIRPVDRITELQLFEFREAFEKFDVNRSGDIDRQELVKLCDELGQDVSEQDLEEMFALGAWQPCATL